MFYLNVWLTVKNADDAPRIRDLLTEAARKSRTEPGCRRFEVYQLEDRPEQFVLEEHWESKEAWETHRTAEAFTQIYQPRVLPLVERQPHVLVRVE